MNIRTCLRVINVFTIRNRKMSSHHVLSAAPGLDMMLSTLIYDELTKDDASLMKSPSQKSIFSDSESNNSFGSQSRSSVIVENEFYNPNGNFS